MAHSIRSRRATIAAGVLSFALIAPLVTAPEMTVLPEAVAQEDAAQTAATNASVFTPRYQTANFWNQPEAVIQGLQLQPGDKVEPTTHTIFNWYFRNDNGTLTAIRPKAAASFKTGNVDVAVRVTPAGGAAFTTTLRLNVVDRREASDWESQLDARYPIDFNKSTAARQVAEITLPANVSVSKGSAKAPAGWSVTTSGGKLSVTPPAAFTESDIDLPVTVNDGTDTFNKTLRITASNPQTTGSEVRKGLGGLVGSLIGGILGGGDRDKSLLEGLVQVEVQPSAVIITGNANPTVDIRDNASNNGNNNGNNNGSNNSAQAEVIVTNNANPNVQIHDNANNNGSNNSANADVLITGNANPTNNGNNNGSGNAVVVTDNGKANVDVKITDNVNPELGAGSSRRGKNSDAEGRKGAGAGAAAVTGGLSDPRCVASLTSLGIPLLLMIPVALAQALNIPALNGASSQAAGIFDETVRQFGLEPAQATAVGGGIVGVVLTAIAAAAAATCIPREVPVAATPVINTATAPAAN